MVDEHKNVMQIKHEKRVQEVPPGVPGVARRRFLTYLGSGVAALAAASAGVFTAESDLTEAAPAPQTTSGDDTGRQQAPAPFFAPIAPSDADDILLPQGYRYSVVRKWNDTLGGDMRFGYNNDWIAYYPIDGRTGGNNSTDGILAVNHEYVDSKWVSNYTDPMGATRKTREQIEAEKAAVGMSFFRVRRDGNEWRFVEDMNISRRLDANTMIDITGPVAGSAEFGGRREVRGTLANCGGGMTPWGTALTCEENFQDYYGEATGREPMGNSYNSTYRWLDDPERREAPEAYGYVVEVDPYDKNMKPRKHSWLGRVRHENVAVTIAPDGRAVVYTGEDRQDECMYKFVSKGTYNPSDRAANMNLLTDGMLYVANFSSGRWIPLDFANPAFARNMFKSQADILMRTSAAAKSTGIGGTPLDRCEDIDIDPASGTVYAALTNNSLHGNFYGQIIRLFEAGNNPTATEFSFEVYAAGGPNTGFASPDNLTFDGKGNLYIVTDISSSSLNKGIYRPFKNNGMFVMPVGPNSNFRKGDAYQFASAPVESEMTGPAFTPDGRTLFIAIQHPGEETTDKARPTSNWPDKDGTPKPSIVAITGFE